MEWFLEYLKTASAEALRFVAVPSLALNIWLLYELRSLYNKTIDRLTGDKDKFQELASKGLGSGNQTLDEALKIVALLDRRRKDE